MSNSVTTDFSEKNASILFSGIRVLVVEDVAVHQIMAKTILEKYGCIVELSNNGLNAVDKVHGKKFNLIFMDYYLPKLSGPEVTTKIRTTENLNKNTPIIAFSGEEAEEVIAEDIKHNGMNGYIMKPIDEEKMVSVMSSLLRKQKV